MKLEFVPTEIRPADVKQPPRKQHAPRVAKKKRTKKPQAPVLVEGLTPWMFNLLVSCYEDLVTQPGLLPCSLPNCGYRTRCRLATTGAPVCALCSFLIQKGFIEQGWWKPEKRTNKSVAVGKDHVRLLGGPQDHTNVRCATGKGTTKHRWNNGFIIEGTHAELYVYDPEAKAYRWWDRS